MVSLPSPVIVNSTMPFAGDSTAEVATIPAESQSGYVNFKLGFPGQYSVAPESGGFMVTRETMNALGRFATAAPFYGQCGGFYTFNADVAVAISGYPKYACLDYLDTSTNVIHRVVSLVANNKVDFTGTTPTETQAAAGVTAGTVDGKNWAYADAASAGDGGLSVNWSNADAATVCDSTTVPTYGSWSLIGSGTFTKSGVLYLTTFDMTFTTSVKKAGNLYTCHLVLGGNDGTEVASVNPDAVQATSTCASVFLNNCVLDKKVDDAGTVAWEWQKIPVPVRQGTNYSIWIRKEIDEVEISACHHVVKVY